MISAEFREALSKLRFLPFPDTIDQSHYRSDIAREWLVDPVRTFFRLTDADQEKVWMLINPGRRNA